MKLSQRVKKYMGEPWEIVRAMAPLYIVSLGIYVISNILPIKENSKILPYEHGGLPTPFMTELVDYPNLTTCDENGNIMPFDKTLLHSIGPMFYNGQERKPTQKEIDYWYRSQK